MESENSQWRDEDDVEEVRAFTQGFSVSLLKECRDKIYGWCKAANSEISGLGLVEKDGSEFLVHDVFLLEQECGPAFTELDDGAIAELQKQLHKRKIKLSSLRFWWHTHYNFSCFWSGIDVSTCSRLCGSSADWMLAMVINQKDQYKCRLDIYKPIRIAVDDITVGVRSKEQKLDLEKYRREVQSKVKQFQFMAGQLGRDQSLGGFGLDYRDERAHDTKRGVWVDNRNKGGATAHLSTE